MSTTKIRLDSQATAKDFTFDNDGTVNFGSSGTGFTVNVRGNQVIDGNLTVEGTETINDVQTVNSNAIITGDLTVGQGAGSNFLTITDGTDIIVEDDSATPVQVFLIDGATGNLDSEGTGDFADTLTCSKGAGTGLQVTANAAIGGTLGVTGLSTLTGGLAVPGGTVNVDVTSDFSGNVVLSNAADLTMYDASATPVAVFTVDGATGNTAIAGNLDVSDSIDVLSAGFVNLWNSGNTDKGTLQQDGTTLEMYPPVGGDVEIGAIGAALILGTVGNQANLEFEESSTISGQGENTISFGESGDTMNLNVSGVTYLLPPHDHTGDAGDGDELTAYDLQRVTGYGATTTNSITMDDAADITFQDASATPVVMLTLDGGAGSITMTGDLKWYTDGGGDIGASAASRPDVIYAKTNVVIGDTLTLDSSSITGSGNVTINVPSANDLIVKDTEVVPNTILVLDQATGQLQLPTTGSTAGLLIGGDAALYRSAADKLKTPDNFDVAGALDAGTDGSVLVHSIRRDAGSGESSVTLEVHKLADYSTSNRQSIQFTFKDDGGDASNFAGIEAGSIGVTGGAEEGALYLRVLANGSGVDGLSVEGTDAGGVESTFIGNVTVSSAGDFFVKDASATPVTVFSVDGATGQTVVAGALTLTGSSVAGSGQLTFDDQWLASAIPLSENGETALVDFTATSIVGALNELKTETVGSESIWQRSGGDITPKNPGDDLIVTGAGDLSVQDASATPVTVFTVDGATGNVSLAGDLVWASDGGGDIGADGSSRPANLYLDTSLKVGSGAGAGDGDNVILSHGAVGGGMVMLSKDLNDQYMTVAGSGTISMSGTNSALTIFGSNQAGSHIQLWSTSNVTRGKILFEGTSAYDCVNARLGIGTQSPGYELDVEGGSARIDGNLLIDNAGDFTIQDASATPVTVFEVDGATGNTSMAGTLYAGDGSSEPTIQFDDTNNNYTATDMGSALDEIGSKVVDGTNMVWFEQANEAPNGIITAFTFDNAYVSGKTMVFLNGQMMHITDDVTESNPGAGEVTFGIAPDTNDKVWAVYLKA